ncbi:hypothetical protein C5B42_01525 [Candidatus Cerribacteria bacterium 'Amazon FNV 2010 28 9']|uniref:DUF1189 domain-containing protein n=1 Tax=Candidatus Cerribacteria bacterium 'Amazon FNV 2010 28 9' TaxID=2081795 RepID=A0A317JQV8_9BACT|nr:MAG: hypothetical protein C5B42_01525 [Candidatus Cerribacteria bacterium 'Amazon FNV 2010 28 9']
MIRKLRTYIRTLIKSASEPSYYREVLQAKVWFSVQFFLVSVVLATIGLIIVLRLYDVPMMLSTTKTSASDIIAQLPDTTFFSYTNNTLTTQGLTLPFTFTSPSELTNLGAPKNIAVITSEDHAQSSALFTITPHAIYADGDDTEKMTYDTIFDSNWSAKKSDLPWFVNQNIEQVRQSSTAALLVFSPFLFIIQLLVTGFILFFFTFFASLLAWVLGIKLPFIKLIQLGLHAMSIGILIDLVPQLFGVHTSISLTGPAYIGIMLLAFFSIRSKQPQKH